MSRRLEIELTSAQPDGSWTWRAAGAREPRGDVDARLLPKDARVGVVLRVEADMNVEGITITAVLPAKAQRGAPELLEMIGSGRSDGPLVTETRVRGGKPGPPRERDNDRPRGRGDRGDRARTGARRGAPGGSDRRETKDRPARTAGGRDTERKAPQGDRRPRADKPRREGPPPPPKAPRLRPGRSHRNALVKALSADHLLLTEELLRGGVPEVRASLDRLNATLTADAKTPIDGAPVLDLAERLMPAVRLAEWRDRADAALLQISDVDLRDLRSTLVAADSVARDDESRGIAQQLRTAVAERVEREHRAWLDDIAALLAEGRLVRALKASSRPPKAGTPFPVDLGRQLAEATAAGLADAHAPDRFTVVLEALSVSPVRQQVEPPRLAEPISPDILKAVRRFGEQLPRFRAAYSPPTPAAPAPSPPAVPPPPPVPVPADPASQPQS